MQYHLLTKHSYSKRGCLVDRNSDNKDDDIALASLSFWLLNSVAVIWDTQHVVVKTSPESFASPAVLNFRRFAMSAALFSPALFNVLVSQL